MLCELFEESGHAFSPMSLNIALLSTLVTKLILHYIIWEANSINLISDQSIIQKLQLNTSQRFDCIGFLVSGSNVCYFSFI